MHFSAFLTSRSDRPEHDREVIHGMIDHAIDAEKRGFDAVFLPDHHFTGYAPPASDPMMFASYLAALIPRVQFGFSVQTVPLHHPVRFAERVALLDQLTDGRILVGLASGNNPEEMIGFGVHYPDSKELSDNNLEIVARLWAKKQEDPPVEFENKYYRGAVVSRILPARYSDVSRKLMSVALRPASMERSAKGGQPAFIPAFAIPLDPEHGDPLKLVTERFNDFRRALDAAGHDDATIAAALDWTTHTYQYVHLAETDEIAERELDVLLDEYQRAVEHEQVANKLAEKISGVNLPPSVSAQTRGWKDTWCLYGSPETVVRTLKQYEQLGIGNILGGYMGGPLTSTRRAMTEQTMDLFSKHVIPEFS
jgi:alkanesulfonate monooxygenase SsuD/methylene tetrahydromethanopterin reductase-like flavin-dependent oxidoreductase (luciferase family)